MKNRGNTIRHALLNGTGTAALATLIASGAHAGETRITPTITPPTVDVSVQAHAAINNPQQNIGSAAASITDAEATSGATGTDSAVSATVDSNAIKASAIGNDFTNAIDLSVIPTVETLGTGDGAAALGFSVNIGPISSSVVDSDIAALHADFPLGTIGVTGNGIAATTSGNKGSTLLQGAVLPDYASDAAGSSAITSGELSLADWLNATGSLVASTVQAQSGGIYNTATATDNDIALSIRNATDDASVVASPALEDNTIAATVTGNSSNSTIDVQEGGASTLAGTAVVTNGQINSSPEAASSIVASNSGSEIVATIAADDTNTGDDAELQGSLSVAGNAITASASGNQALGATADQAGNRILLADGASFAGSANTVSPGTDTAFNAGALTSTVNADLVIHSSQGNAGAGNETRLAITGSEDDGEIAAVVDDISGGSVAVSGNRITGTANGNAASSAFASGDNMASFAGSAALANQQVNFYTNVFAEGTGNIDARISDGDEVTKSTMSVDGNTVGATAYGSSASQSLALDAVAQTLPLTSVTLTGGTGGEFSDGNVDSSGSLTITSLQANYNSDVDSREVHEIYAAVGDAVVNSTIAVKGNTAEAVSVGASTANKLALSGTALGSGAGIVSVQLNDDDDGDDLDLTDVSASSTGYTHLDTAAGVDSSTVELSGNLQRAIAYGGSASNTLNVSGETVTVDGDVDGIASQVSYDGFANDGMALTFTDQPAVNAANGLLNVQSLNGDIAATALAADWSGVPTAFAVNVDGDVDGSSVVNGGHLEDGVAVGGNALVAAAYGADAVNAAGFDVGTVATSDNDFASVMNLTNVQETTFGSSVTAQAAGAAAVYTEVSGDNDVTDSSVSTSYNSVQALAYANRAANSVSASGTQIDTEADFFPIRGEIAVDGEGASTDASFSLNNAQVAGGIIGATLVDTIDEASTSAAVLTTIGGDVTASSVVSEGNALTSGATGNRADNTLDLTGNGLATTSAVSNFQVVSAGTGISSNIGVQGGIQNVMVDPGTPDIDPVPFNFGVGGSGLAHDSEANMFTAGTLTVDVTLLTEAERDALLADGWSEAGENTYSRSAIGYSATAVDYLDLTLGGTFSRSLSTALIPGTPATFQDVYVPGSGGVTIAIGADIEGSTVSVNGNTTSGSVTGNSARNALAVSGTGVEDGSDHLLSYGTVNGSETEANGDHMVVNRQLADPSSLSSAVNGSFGIDANDGVDIGSSTLAVDGNSQTSRSVANTADNSVELDANNTAAGTVLVSNQQSLAYVVATSNLDIYTPVASLGSQVSMSTNTNLALGVQNDATNTLTVDANSANPVTNPIDAIADVDVDAVAYGDHVLVSSQQSFGPVQANAATAIYNQDSTDADTSGVFNGSVSISGNSTVAEASANRAVNVANVSAGSSLGAAAGVTNSQESLGPVTSSATTTAGIALASDTVSIAALNGGSVTVDGNTTTALARGNAATNALNYSAGANYGIGAGDAATSQGAVTIGSNLDGRSTAQAAVLNAQVNVGPVYASATGASYSVVLNGGPASPATTNGTIALTGNTVSAAAYGNTANNSLTLASLNSGQPTAAIGNYQTNVGPVTASVTSVTYGVSNGLGAVTGSTHSVAGNQITATAVGNSAVSTIGAR